MIFKYITYVLILQKCYHVPSTIACLFRRYINNTKSSFYNFPQSPLLEFRDSWLRDFSWCSIYKFLLITLLQKLFLSLSFVKFFLHKFSQRLANHYIFLLPNIHEKCENDSANILQNIRIYSDLREVEKIPNIDAKVIDDLLWSTRRI